MSLDLTDISQLKPLLKKYRLWAKKRLGQHFLVDRSVLDTMVETAQISKEDTILEIGAGTGVLTRELLPRAKKTIAIEIDKDILPLLKETTHFFRDRMDLRHEHILNIVPPKTPYKVVANIPYQLTSPILRKFLVETEDRPETLTLLVQKEMAEKICHTAKKSLLSLFVETFGEAKIVRNVPASAFHPPPKVQSAVLHISVFPKPRFQGNIQSLFSVAKMGFSQKRKKLKNTLPKDLLERSGVDIDKRAEALSWEEWEQLAGALKKDQKIG